jgi:hypothetical protein
MEVLTREMLARALCSPTDRPKAVLMTQSEAEFMQASDPDFKLGRKYYGLNVVVADRMGP